MTVDKVNEMSFFEHLEDLRWHLMRSVVAVLIVAVVVFVTKDWVFEKIIYAPRYESFVTYRWFCSLSETTCFSPASFKIQAFKIEELFVTAIKSSLVLGFIATFPYFFYEMWSFVRPGLLDKEAKAARGIVFNCSMLFLAGVLFGYYIITPFALSFLTSFTLGDAVAQPTLSSYLNSMIMFTIPTGMVFELPIVIYVLASAGIVSSQFLKKQRKVAFVGILVLAAVVTPPDVITQFMIGFPLYGLYEAGIVIAKRIEKRKAKEEYDGAK